jgi:peptide/nickel transport system substrate-binding protein
MRLGRASALVLGLLVVASACQSAAPAPSTSSSASPAAAKQGGTVVIGITDEPDTLFQYASRIFNSYFVNLTLSTPLLRINSSAQLEPELASEVPTVANGGISPDGKTITVKLRKEAVWEDGRPVTSKDLAFTWKTLMDKKSAATSTLGWDRIASIDTPDDQTAVIKLTQPYAPFVSVVLAGQFGGRLLPEHVLGTVTDITKSDFARKPVGNGSFKIVEWVSGDHITVERSAKFWGPKPPLDRIIFKISPDRNVLLAQLKAGTLDIVTDLTEANSEDVKTTQGVSVLSVASSNIELLNINLNMPSDLTKPHPVLGELAVRQAIAYGINRQGLIDGVLFGKAKLAVNEQDNTRYFNTDLKPYPFDVAKAKSTLEDAGWKAGADGVRVKNGVTAKLQLSTSAGNKIRESMQTVIQQQLKDIGFAIEIKNYPPSELFAGCAAKGIKQSRQFDLLLDSFGLPGLDPDPTSFWHSTQIPDCKARLVGGNRSGFSTPELDRLLEAQLATADDAKRTELIKQIQKIVYDNVAAVYVYDRLNIVAAAGRVQGLTTLPLLSGSIFSNVERWSVTDGK